MPNDMSGWLQVLIGIVSIFFQLCSTPSRPRRTRASKDTTIVLGPLRFSRRVRIDRQS